MRDSINFIILFACIIITVTLLSNCKSNKKDSTEDAVIHSTLSPEERKRKASDMMQVFENRYNSEYNRYDILCDLDYNIIYICDTYNGTGSLIDVSTGNSLVEKVKFPSESRAEIEPSGNYIHKLYYNSPYLYITSGFLGEGGYTTDYNTYIDGYYTSVNKIENNNITFVNGLNGYIDYINNELILNRPVSINGLAFYIPYTFSKNDPNQLNRNGSITDLFDNVYGKYTNIDSEDARRRLYNEGMAKYMESVENMIKYDADRYAKENIKVKMNFANLKELREEGKKNALRFNDKYRGKTFFLNETIADLDEPMLSSYNYRIRYVNNRSVLFTNYDDVYTNDRRILDLQKGEKAIIKATLSNFDSNTYTITFNEGEIVNNLTHTALTDEEINKNEDYKKQYQQLYSQAFNKYQKEVLLKVHYNVPGSDNYDIHFINDYSDNYWKTEHAGSVNKPDTSFTSDYSDGLLTEKDLQGLSKAQLRIMRNEIFARHGLIFKSQDLQDHFSQQPWYNPQYTDVNNMLTPTEKKNIEFIKKHE